MKRVGITLLSLLIFFVLQTYVYAIPSISAADAGFSASLQRSDQITASGHILNESFASAFVPEYASLLLLGLGLIGLGLYGRKRLGKKKEA